MTTSFEPFRRLPAELRLDIWQEALEIPSGRVLQLKLELFNLGGFPRPVFPQLGLTFCRRLPPPTLTKVCRESRYVAKRHLVTFSSTGPSGAFETFQPYCDTFYLSNIWLCVHPDFESLPHWGPTGSAETVAISPPFPRSSWIFFNGTVLQDVCATFPSMKELKILVSSRRDDCDQAPLCIKDISIADKIRPRCRGRGGRYVRKRYYKWRRQMRDKVDVVVLWAQGRLEEFLAEGLIASVSKVSGGIIFRSESCLEHPHGYAGRETRWMREVRNYGEPNVYV